MGAVVQTAMVSATGSARYTPITGSGHTSGSTKINGISKISFRQTVRKIVLDAWSKATKLY